MSETDHANPNKKPNALILLLQVVIVSVVAALIAALLQKLILGNPKAWLTISVVLVAAFGTLQRSWRR